MNNKVVITNSQTKEKIPSGMRLLIRRCCNAVLNKEKILSPVEISISLIDNEEIKRLNGEFRGKPVETDVLSFPLYEKEQIESFKNMKTPFALGDIALSVEKAFKQASIYNHSIQREIAFLVVHSMLHLLGYEHEKGGLQEVYMREKEEAILVQLGLSRGFNYIIDEV